MYTAAGIEALDGSDFSLSGLTVGRTGESRFISCETRSFSSAIADGEYVRSSRLLLIVLRCGVTGKGGWRLQVRTKVPSVVLAACRCRAQ